MKLQLIIKYDKHSHFTFFYYFLQPSSTKEGRKQGRKSEGGREGKRVGRPSGTSWLA